MAWNQFSSAEDIQITKIVRQDNADRYFDAVGIIHLEFIPVGTTMKSHFYFVVLNHLYVSMQFRNKSWLLLHDKVPDYMVVECESISCFQIELHDPASHLLAAFVTGKFFLFPKVNGT